MNDTFLRACRGEETDYTPVWLMRQAGRYLPEYQKVRSKVDFLTLCKTPELAAEVTLQPVDILKVDAAILFSDILVPVEPMGLHLEFSESKGPVLSNPVRDEAGVKNLRGLSPDDDVPFVLEAIRILRQRLPVPLIGFSGAPFTLATYMIEGGTSRNFLQTKKMMFRTPEVFSLLMDKITDMVISYLSGQIRAGVQAVQIFDSWVGILSPLDFRRFALPAVRRIIASLKGQVPVIYFAMNADAMLDDVREAGADIYGLDWRIEIQKALSVLGIDAVVQGNLDPCILFGTRELIRGRVGDVLRSASGARGHIFNLGHGILPETPPDNAKAMVDAVHDLSSR